MNGLKPGYSELKIILGIYKTFHLDSSGNKSQEIRRYICQRFPETFTRCCGLGVQRPKPQRHYSTLLKNGRSGNESTDSARDDTVQTNTSLSHKNSSDSFGGSLR
ncbi:hypothetical protein GWI33_021903 [Rhynchophorus ferrugineus]|uniref:Uncharacterized protein n=1 Tax=Rhynchophorus ferrugineus TaxID=354439 RepID=A0A834HNC2_RHYFE|nr:hypothetical protein GWI33_021904 [Rhynchophorus ferrugineus]KAF7264939.1 hypothetical protein GWI33_021903 [Rhynchophorus ferrugineus]